MFGDIFSMLSQQGPDAWYTTATQLALNIARGEDGDPNPQPTERQRLEELAPLVGRHVDALFGVSREAEVEAVNRSALTLAALEQWRPLMGPLLTPTVMPPGEEIDLADESRTQLLAQITSTIGPLFAGFQMGSVAGHFSGRAWSLAALPLPRNDERRLLVVNNLANFANEWSLERDEVYVFALAQEFVASLVLTQPGTGDALRALLIDAVNEASAVQGDLLGRLQSMLEVAATSTTSWTIPRRCSRASRRRRRATPRARSTPRPACCSPSSRRPPSTSPRRCSDRDRRFVEAYARHRRSDARGEDAAAALFGITTQGPHHEAATHVRLDARRRAHAQRL